MRFFLIFVLVVTVSVAGVGLFAWNNYNAASSVPDKITVILPKGTGFVGSVQILAEKGVIAYPYFFKAIGYITGDARKIKAGEYLFPDGVSPKSVMQMLVGGKVVVHKITIPEGLTTAEILQLVAAEAILEGEVPTGLAEGSLLPETYHFTYGDSKADVITRMQEKMQTTINELWEKRAQNLPIKTKEEAVILASIVEKETGIAGERPRVAAVFINRLRKNMKLQSDPTVAYGVEAATGKPMERQLYSSDLKNPTPFNTYVIPALPPSPIANPGRDAIAATLNPLTTNELYFVATGSGGHNFSTNLDDHNRYVRAYREIMAQK